MNFSNLKASNATIAYIIIAIVVLVIILLVGGADWLRGSQLNRSIGISNWNWTQILTSLGIGFAIGWAIFKKNW